MLSAPDAILSVLALLSSSLPAIACGLDTHGLTGSITSPGGESATDVSAQTSSSDTSHGTSAITTMTANTQLPTTTVDVETTGPASATDTDTTSPQCEPEVMTLSPDRPRLLLVLDKSGSMVVDPAGHWDADNDPNTPTITLWNSLHQVVSNTLLTHDANVDFGVLLCPSTSAVASYSATACPVNSLPEVLPGPGNADAILAGIPAGADTTLKGGTPMADAMAIAYDALRVLPPNTSRAAVMVTDSPANCNTSAPDATTMFEVYDGRVHMLVADAFTIDKLPTYVVGLDVTNATTGTSQDGIPDNVNLHTKLSELAILGGRPRAEPNDKFYNAEDQFELQAAFDAIVTDVRGCVLVLPGDAVPANEIEVLLGDAEVAQISDCATENGWTTTTVDGQQQIELCGEACTDLKLLGQADVRVGCLNSDS